MNFKSNISKVLILQITKHSSYLENILPIYTDAVRRGSMDSPPAAQIEDEVKVWFRNARDRAGGRRQRYIRVAAQDV